MPVQRGCRLRSARRTVNRGSIFVEYDSTWAQSNGIAREQDMIRFALAIALSSVFVTVLDAHDVDALAGKRVVFLGDSITQAGGYIGFMDYALERQNPEKHFDLLGLGLASETLSGLSEDGHA